MAWFPLLCLGLFFQLWLVLYLFIYNTSNWIFHHSDSDSQTYNWPDMFLESHVNITEFGIDCNHWIVLWNYPLKICILWPSFNIWTFGCIRDRKKVTKTITGNIWWGLICFTLARRKTVRNANNVRKDQK